VAVDEGAVLGRPALTYRDETVPLVAARASCAAPPGAGRSLGEVAGAPAELEGRCPRGQVGEVGVASAGRGGAGARLITARRSTRPALTVADVAARHGPSPHVFLLGSLPVVLLRGRRPRPSPATGPRDMIITVTLNAAIDKSLSVPSFRLGRRHRTVDQTTMAGGKGVNVARALKVLGQPVIATGFAGGPTGTRIVEQLTQESILNDFVRIREESRTNTAVYDPTNGETTEINERGPAVARRRSSSSATSSSTSRAARTSSSSPARCPAASTATSTRA
jgi:hypothetical protein